MLAFTRNSLIVFFSFLFFAEIIVFMTVLDWTNKQVKAEFIHDKHDERSQVFFIGDSYAQTAYLKRGFPVLMQAYCDNAGFAFHDFTMEGTELNTHLSQLQDISSFHPKIIVHFYNINDVISLDTDLFAGRNDDIHIDKEGKKIKGKKISTLKKSMNIIREKSRTFILLRDISHWIIMHLFDRPAPGSTTFELPASNVRHKDDLRDIFTNTAQSCDELIIVVTSPLQYGASVKTWEHYELFHQMDLPDNVHRIQWSDIIGDAKYALSWRNGHANQAGVDKMWAELKKIMDNIK